MWRILPFVLLAACTSPPANDPPPAPNTGLLRPSLTIDPGIHAPVPNPNPGTTPVIPPNPRLDAR